MIDRQIIRTIFPCFRIAKNTRVKIKIVITMEGKEEAKSEIPNNEYEIDVRKIRVILNE